MGAVPRLGRWVLAVLAAMAIVLAAGVLMQGWIIFRDPIHMRPFSYLNKRLDGPLILAPVVTVYFLIVYQASKLIWRRRFAALSPGEACRRGAIAGSLPGFPLFIVGEPVLALISVATGAGVFGLLRLIAPVDAESERVAMIKRHLLISIIVGAAIGAAFTAWVFHVHLWKHSRDDFYVAAGVISYQTVVRVALEWFIAATATAAAAYWLVLGFYRVVASLASTLLGRDEDLQT